MKVLVAKFTLEANANIPVKCDLPNVSLKYGRDAVGTMMLNGIFEKNGIEVIQSLSADAGSSGVMKYEAFRYIADSILRDIREHLNELNGIYLHFHGASEIENIGSGDHYMLREIRKIVGPYLPIGIACDPHGNLCKEYVENTTIIRSYRESPHTDIEETIKKVCTVLIDQIKNPTGIHSVYRKLPMILGGEQSVSADEPVRTINKHLDEMEKDPKIISASWHVGYIRHDCDVAGCGIVVVPSRSEYQEYAEQKADELAEYVFGKRHEFHYTGLTAMPEEALKMALEAEGRPFFITDSGDNVTSGSTGANTFVLRQFMALKDLNKKVLFAAIRDEKSWAKLNNLPIGETCDIALGECFDELSAEVDLSVKVLAKGRQIGTKLFAEEGDFGGAVRVSVESTPIEIIVTDTNHPFVERQQTEVVGANWNDYDIIIVKTGYAFPEVKEYGNVMSLTEGATLQDTSRLPFKRIMRPMFPIDKI